MYDFYPVAPPLDEKLSTVSQQSNEVLTADRPVYVDEYRAMGRLSIIGEDQHDDNKQAEPNDQPQPDEVPNELDMPNYEPSNNQLAAVA